MARIAGSGGTGSGGGGGGGSTGANNVPCDPTVDVGLPVRYDGSGLLINAMADSQTNANAVGICIAKPTADTANVIFVGPTGDIYGGTLDPDATYWLGIAGGLTTTPPSLNDFPDAVQVVVGIPYSTGGLVVRVSPMVVGASI